MTGQQSLDSRALELATAANSKADRTMENLIRHEDRCMQYNQDLLAEVKALRQENSAQHDTTVSRFTDSIKGVHNRIDEVKRDQAASELASTSEDYENKLALERRGRLFYRSLLGAAFAVLGWLLASGVPWQ